MSYAEEVEEFTEVVKILSEKITDEELRKRLISEVMEIYEI